MSFNDFRALALSGGMCTINLAAASLLSVMGTLVHYTRVFPLSVQQREVFTMWVSARKTNLHGISL